MATLTSSRLCDLIERLRYARWRMPHAVFDIVRVEHPAIRALAQSQVPSPETMDQGWLDRVELRGPDKTRELLETSGFAEQTGMTAALFVDRRCGLIRLERIGAAASLDPQASVALALRLATECDASGIVLATHDLGGRVAGGRRYRRFTRELQSKGEAIDVVLLDHFVLTARGWRQMSPGTNHGAV